MHRQTKKDLYVVTPEWIVESVHIGKRWSEVSFSLFTDNNGIPFSMQSRLEEVGATKKALDTGACAISKPLSPDGRVQERVTGVGERAMRRLRFVSSSPVMQTNLERSAYTRTSTWIATSSKSPCCTIPSSRTSPRLSPAGTRLNEPPFSP